MRHSFLLLLLCCQITYAQQNITKKLGDYSTLKLYHGLTVELQKSTSNELVISGDRADEVSVKNVNGILKIRLNFPDGFTDYEQVNILVRHKGSIVVLDANEGSKIISKEPIQQEHLEVKVQEGARIELPVEVKFLSVKTVSGGLIWLTGKTQTTDVVANTGGIYKGFNIDSEQAIATSSTGSIVEINATVSLNAKASLGGTIYYKGNPEDIIIKRVIGGTIKNKN